MYTYYSTFKFNKKSERYDLGYRLNNSNNMHSKLNGNDIEQQAVIRMPFQNSTALNIDCYVFDKWTEELLYTCKQGDYAYINCESSRVVNVEVHWGISPIIRSTMEISKGDKIDLKFYKISFFKYGLKVTKVDDFIKEANHL